MERLILAGGCNDVVLTWPDGTPLATVATAISPPDALSAIWRVEADGRFTAWSPLPDAPNDLKTVNHLDEVFICMRSSAVLVQPGRER